MSRVLLVQPSLMPPGGGNGVANWMIQALRGEHDVTVLTWRPVDVEVVNSYYGTSLRAADFRVRRLPARYRVPFHVLPTPAAHLRRCVLLRECRRLASGFDVLVTAHNEADFGRRGIQYVHYPWTQRRSAQERRWFHPSAALGAYYRACAWVGAIDLDRVRANLTLANSAWTGRLLTDRLGIEPRVLHPPVAGEFPAVAWEDRADAFVCLGRFAREKRLELIVEIVERVRRERPAVELSIVASRDDPDYEREIRALARDRPWVTLHSDVPRSELERLVARHRWGIHGMAAEHFGMAVAELARAGCVVFAPDDGGQIEIVTDERLVFGDAAEAAAKALRAMSDPGLLGELRAHLAERALAFSAEHFMSGFRAVVREVAAQRRVEEAT